MIYARLAAFTLALLLASATSAMADEAPPAPPAAGDAAAPPAGPAAPAAPTAPMPPAPRATAAATVVDAGACGCCPPRDPCRKRHLELQAHGALLTTDPEGLISVDSGTANQARWDALDYGVAIGGRVAYTFPWTCWDVRIAGTWWGSWDADTTTSGTLTDRPTPNAPPNPPVAFANIPLHEEATLWDLDVTATQPFYCSPCFTAEWGAGLRYLRFDEEARFAFTQGIAAPVTTTLGADVENGLLAAEAVLVGTWKLNSCWDFKGRASAFVGWMHRDGVITSINQAPPLVGTTDETDDLGFGGELELALQWHANSCWTLSVGYGLLVLGNVTRAHEALDFNNVATLDIGPVFTDDTLLVHRFFVGAGIDF